jgi:hypothetical protein
MSNINTQDEKFIRSSHKVLTVTSSNFEKLREDINNIYETRVKLRKELKNAKLKLYLFMFLNIITINLIPSIKKNKGSNQEKVKTLKESIEKAFVEINFSDNSQLEKRWLNCIDTFKEIMKSEKIWDLVYSKGVNTVKERTIADKSIDRKEIHQKNPKPISFIKSDLEYLYLPNINGPDIYIYTTFLIIFKNYDQFGIFDLKDINLELTLTQFIEQDKVPKDSEIVDHTWAKTNKNGTPDKRFKGNYQIPIAKYGQLFIKSETGLHEGYMFSNAGVFTEFIHSMENHISQLKSN